MPRRMDTNQTEQSETGTKLKFSDDPTKNTDYTYCAETGGYMMAVYKNSYKYTRGHPSCQVWICYEDSDYGGQFEELPTWWIGTSPS